MLENTNEIPAATLYDSDEIDTRKEAAKLTITTAWVETGYSHAKEYQLDLLFQIDTTEEMQQGRHIFWYMTFPKESSTEADPINETIYADYNPTVDTRMSFFQTGPLAVLPNTKPNFSASPNIEQQELIKGYRSRSNTSSTPEYVGWELLPKLSVEDKTQL